MSYDLSKPLVIGISSRALFNLEQENKIFEEQGVEYHQAGDYMLPNVEQAEQNEYQIGVWGSVTSDI